MDYEKPVGMCGAIRVHNQPGDDAIAVEIDMVVAVFSFALTHEQRDALVECLMNPVDDTRERIVFEREEPNG